MNLASPELFPSIPSDTASAARFVFTTKNFYLTIGDQVNQLFGGLSLDNPLGWLQGTERTSAMLFLITIFQYIETLSDSQTMDALQKRVDWKYALHLPLEYPGLEGSVLCVFRKRLLVDPASQHNFERLLARLNEILMVTRKQTVGLEPTELIHCICLLNCLSTGFQAISEVLDILATSQPEWLRYIALPHWYDRYGFQQMKITLAGNKAELEAVTRGIGADGTYLLKEISESNNQVLADLPQVSTLKQVWRDQYSSLEGEVVLRDETCSGCKLSTQYWNKNKQ